MAVSKADEHTQQKFFDYLKAHLSFSFKADYWPTSAIGPKNGGKVTVLGSKRKAQRQSSSDGLQPML
jgi:hypothetical protein